MRITRLAVTIFLIIAFSALPITVDSAEPKRITTIEGITEFRLDNGLRVLLFPDPSKPTVTVSLTMFVGSRHEGYGEAGMAHLLEHMLFKGTPTHPNVPKVLQELERLLKDGGTAKELEAAKSGYLQSRKVARTNDGQLAGVLASNLHLERTMAFQADLEKKIQAVTTDELAKALRKYIDVKNLVIVAAGDFKKPADTGQESSAKGETSTKQ